MHEKLCFTKDPKLAGWAAGLFGIFGILGLFNLHDRIGTATMDRILSLAAVVMIVTSLVAMKCLFERVLCALLISIYGLVLCVALLRLQAPGQLFAIRATITSIWFVMALICLVWAMRTRVSAH